MGVEATVMGLGFLGLGFGDAAGRPLICTSGSGLGSGGLPSASAFSTSGASALAPAGLDAAGLSADAAFLPKISAVVAAATSWAGMTSPSSAGAGSVTGSG